MSQRRPRAEDITKRSGTPSSRWPRAATLLTIVVLAAAVAWWGGVTGDSFLRLLILVAGASLIASGMIAWAMGRAAQLGLCVASLLLALGAAEVVLRWAVPSQDYDAATRTLYEPDERLGWRFAPSARAVLEQPGGDFRSEVQINAEGFRDVDYPTQGDDRWRVAFLGDSFVANLGVALDEVFTSRLNESLGPTNEVGNRGVSGYGQVQQLRLLEDLLAKDPPDVVVLVVFPHNDFADNLGTLDWLQGYGRPWARWEDEQLQIEDRFDVPDPQDVDEGSGWARRSQLYELARGALLRYAFPRGVPGYREPPELEFFLRESTPRQTEGFAVFDALVELMRDRCQQHDCRFGMVIAPCDWQVDDSEWDALVTGWNLDVERYDRLLPNQEIESTCREAGIPCLDLTPALRQARAEGASLYFAHDRHWNATANAVVAEALEEWLVREQLVSPATD